MQFIPLLNGGKMPAVGLGTWELREEACAKTVKKALSLGYRHIDTAEFYGNEEVIGKCLRESGIPRGELFVTTKVWTDHFRASAFKKAAENSLLKLRLDEVDLLLIHWPNPAVPLAETVGALCQLAKEGKTRAIGVSNFSVPQLQAAVSLASVPIACDQVKFNLAEGQKELLAYAQSKGINITAYTPLGRGSFLLNPILSEIARVHGKTPAQTALRWLVQQKGVSAVPKSVGKKHLQDNLEIFDFELSLAEMTRLGHLAGEA